VPERPGQLAGAPLLDGGMSLSEFNAEYDESLSDVDYTTLGGWIFGQLGRLPQVGDRVTAGRHMLEVAEMEGRRVKRVKLTATLGRGQESELRGQGPSPSPLTPES